MKNIIIDFQHDMVRTALVENGELVEVLIDKKDELSCVGNFYTGIVKNILPNKFVFIDIGHEKNAFLCLTDPREHDLFVNEKLSIKQGDPITIEVIKDATGSKGAFVTSQLSVAGENLVLIKTSKSDIGVSKKIENIEERRRLKNLVKNLLPPQYGLIMRTSCFGKEKEELEKELTILIDKLKKIIEYSKYTKPPHLVLQEESPVEKSIKIFLSADIDQIILNDPTQFEPIRQLSEKVILYEGITPIFTEYFIENQFGEALHKKIWLKSGGFLIIEETEALVVIDVNSGKFVNNKNPNKTIMKTNLEAAKEIGRQLRLRNLSGMIIIDFIDLKHESDIGILLKCLKDATYNDRLPVHVLGMAYGGIAQLTRKKQREPIVKLLKKECKSCQGTGRV